MSIEHAGIADFGEISFDTVHTIGEKILPHLLKYGGAWIDTGPKGETAVNELEAASRTFFGQLEKDKESFSIPKLNVGRRPFQASKADSEPEYFESVIYWGKDNEVPPHKRFPNGDRVPELMHGFDRFRRMTHFVLTKAISEIQDHYDPEHTRYSPEHPLRIHAGTLDQVNFMDAKRIHEEGLAIGELSSHPHEDGTLLTAIWASDPGLEARLHSTGEYQEINFASRSIWLIMASSILTEMTGGKLSDGTPAPGAIPPLFHRVRFPGQYKKDNSRIAIMTFAGPDVSDATKPLVPFVTTKWNAKVDVRKRVIETPDEQYGIGKDFLV